MAGAGDIVGRAAVAMRHYLVTGRPWEALFENWESEFLGMAVFFVLLTFLIQKGRCPRSAPAGNAAINGRHRARKKPQ